MRLVVLHLLVALLLLVPAGAARGACRETAQGPPVTVELLDLSRPSVARTALVACDHRAGRRVRLRSARLEHPIRGLAAGRRIEGASVLGRRVAWAEVSVGPRGTEGTIRVVLVGRRVRKVERVQAFRQPRLRRYPASFDVQLTPQLELAWTQPPANGRGPSRVLARRRSERPRVVDGAVHGHELDLEDDRTLRVGLGGNYEYVDLVRSQGPGCPARERFAPVLETPEVVVSRATYEDFPGSRSFAYRACLRATGADPAIASVGDCFPDSCEFDVVGVDRTWLVAVDSFTGRRDAYSATVETYAAGSGRQGARSALVDGIPPPRAGAPFAVTVAGIPAWISETPEGARLVVGSGGVAAVLDSGPTGTITELAANGGTLRWRTAGEARFALAAP
jgi:hypothetical protein